MPVDLAGIGSDGRKVFKEWKKKVAQHESRATKDRFHKEKRMQEWSNNLASINAYYRRKLSDIEKARKEEEKELAVMRKEEERLLKIADQKKKELDAIKRQANKRRRELEKRAQVLRRSSRLLAKLRRCPNGTRRNNKTKACEKKTKTNTRKRCPNGTRKNKKTGRCDPHK